MEIYNVALIPFIIGVVDLLKQIGLPDKLAGLVSTVLGIILGIVYVAPDNIAEAILVGAALGLGASGLYSTTKNTKEGFTQELK